MNKPLIVLFFIIFTQLIVAQGLAFEKIEVSDSTALSIKMQELAQAYLESEQEINSKDLFRIEILAGDYKSSIKTIKSLREKKSDVKNHLRFIQYESFAKAKIKQSDSDLSFKDSYQSVFKDYLLSCNDEIAFSTNLVFTTYDGVKQFTSSFKTAYENLKESRITFEQALNILKSYFIYTVYSLTEPIIFKEIKADEQRRYIIEEDILIPTKDGAELSVITVRKRGSEPMPSILLFTIYADVSNVNDAILTASKGYVGIVATSRGKRLSKSKIEPYKHENKDVYTVIDWISKQNWSNKKVGMYGGSYNGFAQWASMKEKVHPALKTIVPSVSAAPGIDHPMENNVFLNFSYSWIPYVTNNKYLDNAAYYDRSRWDNLQKKWFISGKPYNKLDSIDGTPNPVFQEWIKHPAYDEYWQNMIPYKNEFSHINIPILSTTGYYDDGQRGAMYYYLEHLKYNPKAEHYLLIGPYDHWGAQFASSANLRGYQIDNVASINIKNNLLFEWFDYILKGKQKPSILKDKVNFQVMGTNQWMNKPSLSEMSNDSIVFHLSKNMVEGTYKLVTDKSKETSSINLRVDLTNRLKINNSDYYPWPIIKDSIILNDGLVFTSEPFKKETIINGSFSGNLIITTNKKDFDFSVILYELTPEGKYFHLSCYIGRASYSKSREKRELITPNELTSITFDNTKIISKKIAKGSRIVIVINGNKNPNGQINYGTGKEVSNESITNTNTPLELRFNIESKIVIPIWKD